MIFNYINLLECKKTLLGTDSVIETKPFKTRPGSPDFLSQPKLSRIGKFLIVSEKNCRITLNLKGLIDSIIHSGSQQEEVEIIPRKIGAVSNIAFL